MQSSTDAAHTHTHTHCMHCTQQSDDSPSDGAVQRAAELPEWAVKALEYYRRSHHIENRQPRRTYNVRHATADFAPADVAQRPHGHAQLKELVSSETHKRILIQDRCLVNARSRSEIL